MGPTGPFYKKNKYIFKPEKKALRCINGTEHALPFPRSNVKKWHKNSGSNE